MRPACIHLHTSLKRKRKNVKSHVCFGWFVIFLLYDLLLFLSTNQSIPPLNFLITFSDEYFFSLHSQSTLHRHFNRRFFISKLLYLFVFGTSFMSWKQNTDRIGLNSGMNEMSLILRGRKAFIQIFFYVWEMCLALEHLVYTGFYVRFRINILVKRRSTNKK